MPGSGATSVLGRLRGLKEVSPKKIKKRKLSPAPIMVRIRPGQGLLGSPRGETKRDGNEGPIQLVNIDYAFEVSAHEITFNDWERCVDGGGCRGYRPDDEGWGRGNRPVINISWNDTQDYLKWLNRETGLRYRLLSEAEWEYVARAGKTTPFYTGPTVTALQANFNGQHPYKITETSPYRRKTLPVGQFAPNQFGVYDILGNAFEWVEDCWNDNHAGAPNDGSARTSGNCKYRIMKGGSWVSHGYQLRAGMRTQYTTDFRYEDYGFRIARTID